MATFEVREADFVKLTTFLLKEYGINLTKKKHLIENRLNSVMTTGQFKNFTDYTDYITSGKANPKDMRILLNKLTTNHTFFMRENSHFEFFKNTILPELDRKYKTKKSISIWSAGCSSGQEPYTLSMIMFDYFGARRKEWDLRLLATDISNHVMTIAKAASYAGDDIKDLPERWRKTYMTKSGNSYTFIPEIRKNVIFREFNLMDPIRFKIPFDVIFCRNVMIYFEPDTKVQLVQRFYNATNDGGYLLIGQSEKLEKNSPYRMVYTSAYKKERKK